MSTKKKDKQKEKETKEKMLNDSEESDSIEIDGKEYVIDKEGNATLDGVIVYNKEQLKKLEVASYIIVFNINRISYQICKL